MFGLKYDIWPFCLRTQKLEGLFITSNLVLTEHKAILEKLTKKRQNLYLRRENKYEKNYSSPPIE